MANVGVPTMDSLHVNTNIWFEGEGGDFDEVMSSPHYDFFDDSGIHSFPEPKRVDMGFPAIQKSVSLSMSAINPPSLNASPVHENKRIKRDTKPKPKAKPIAKQQAKSRAKPKNSSSTKPTATRSKPQRSSSNGSAARINGASPDRKKLKPNKKSQLSKASDCKIEWESLQIDDETARIVFSTVPREHIDELLNEGDSPFTRRHINSGELTEEQKRAIQLVRKRSRAERKSRREKIRRMQVNNLFNELAAKLDVDPVTKDMASILSAAIGFVEKSQAEIDALKEKVKLGK
eukprot:CAMPEP_0204872318 /NCGR_PEP_ID=MMETSP1348-20121228/37846_1 /ASSEMBLY_ACC=CAM_ASM_000700 /TAXON_ID=215587 /ORGANISM="Aplanochytrium stocchinoi, Strain GSBS06" /LENGTH=289 /DNA_ID=CAMNT_0052027109 /DNA_START=127 /DNA_END=996 /DNA_ORIENTATION=-